MDLKETSILGDLIDNHWYYCSKANALNQIVGDIRRSRILDVGAGSGFFSRHLLKEGPTKEAWCVDKSYSSDWDENENDKPIHFRRSIDACSADLVLLMDVLEHVDDDIALLKNYAQKVPKGAHFLISVPAFQFLWSHHDIFLEHRRRYRLSEIENVVRSADLELINSMYYFGLVFPVAVATRLAEKLLPKRPERTRSQLRSHHPLVNSTLAKLCDMELRFMSRNKAFGLTVFCLASKR